MAYAKLPVQDRGGLVNDLLTLALSEKVSIELALELTHTLLIHEKASTVWMSAVEPLYSLGDLFFGHHHWKQYKKYVHSLISNLDDWIWTNPNLLNLAIFFNEPTISSKLTKLFQQGMDSVPPNLQAAVLNNAIIVSDGDVYDQIYQHYLSELNPIQKRRYLMALTNTSSEKNLTHLLTISLDPKLVHVNDRILVIIGISQNPFGQSLAWEFVKHHWSFFNVRGQAIRDLIEEITMNFNTLEKYNDVATFFKHHENVARFTVARSLERIRYNIHWRKKNIDRAYAWLKKFNSHLSK
jgi:aminopeptidase N